MTLIPGEIPGEGQAFCTGLRTSENQKNNISECKTDTGQVSRTAKGI